MEVAVTSATGMTTTPWTLAIYTGYVVGGDTTDMSVAYTSLEIASPALPRSCDPLARHGT
jgi:hypothetical protein